MLVEDDYFLKYCGYISMNGLIRMLRRMVVMFKCRGRHFPLGRECDGM